jgi:hypothetical protein
VLFQRSGNANDVSVVNDVLKTRLVKLWTMAIWKNHLKDREDTSQRTTKKLFFLVEVKMKHFHRIVKRSRVDVYFTVYAKKDFAKYFN